MSQSICYESLAPMSGYLLDQNHPEGFGNVGLLHQRLTAPSEYSYLYGLWERICALFGFISPGSAAELNRAIHTLKGRVVSRQECLEADLNSYAHALVGRIRHLAPEAPSQEVNDPQTLYTLSTALLFWELGPGPSQNPSASSLSSRLLSTFESLQAEPSAS